MIQPFYFIIVDVLATATASIRTTICQVSLWRTVILKKAAAVAKSQ